MVMIRNRSIAWIAFFAILLSALAPTVSRYLATFEGTPPAFMEICSTRSDAQTSAGLPAAPDGSSDPLKVDRCVYCVMHGHLHALLPAGLALVFLPLLRHGFPSLFFSAPTPLHVWSSALARAPPASLT
jgi:hypothetical protein